MAGLEPARSGRIWRVIRWIHRRRPILTAILVLAAPAYTIAAGVPPADLLDTGSSWRFWVPWSLMAFGAGVRLWGSGNLRKNQEITDTGVYVLVRHPLYLGSLSFFLAYFLTVVDPVVGTVLFGVLVGFVYYPTMLAEEEYLRVTFPDQYARYREPPRLLPDLSRTAEAIRTDRFGIDAANRNLGFRSLGFLILLPILLRLLAAVQETITS